jgi:hypothetical protein
VNTGGIGVEIHTLAYNEEAMVPHFFDWYQSRLPQALIVVHDNESTDSTADVVISRGGLVEPFSTGGVCRDDVLIEVKNEAWKGSSADWVIVCDMDEFLDVDQEFLSTTKFDVIRGIGFDMVGVTGNPAATRQGIRAPVLDKFAAWRPGRTAEISFSIGGHDARPQPLDASKPLLMGRRRFFHYKWLSPEYVLERYALLNDRRSELNREMGWGSHYDREQAALLDQWRRMLVAAHLVR